MTPIDLVPAPPRGVSLFLCYAREDEVFVSDLRRELLARGIRVHGDWLLVPGEDFREQIHGLIRGADGLVLVISPASQGSVECRDEIERALEMGKRLLPVLHRDCSDDTAWPEPVRAPQWLVLRDAASEPEPVERLVDAALTDVHRVRLHTVLLQRAADWHAHGQEPSLLLGRRALADAEAWLAGSDSSPEMRPRPTALQRAYVAASRRARTRLLRTLTAGVVALAIAVAGVFGYTRSDSYQLSRILATAAPDRARSGGRETYYRAWAIVDPAAAIHSAEAEKDMLLRLILLSTISTGLACLGGGPTTQAAFEQLGQAGDRLDPAYRASFLGDYAVALEQAGDRLGALHAIKEAEALPQAKDVPREYTASNFARWWLAMGHVDRALAIARTLPPGGRAELDVALVEAAAARDAAGLSALLDDAIASVSAATRGFDVVVGELARHGREDDALRMLESGRMHARTFPPGLERDRAIGAVSLAEMELQGERVLRLAQDGRIDEGRALADSIKSPDRRAVVLARAGSALLASGREADGAAMLRSAESRLETLPEPLVWYALRAIAEAWVVGGHVEEAVRIVRRVNSESSLVEMAKIAAYLPPSGRAADASRIVDAVTSRLRGLTEESRSEGYAWTAVALARLRRFREARLTAEECSVWDHRVAALAVVLVEWARARNPELDHHMRIAEVPGRAGLPGLNQIVSAR